MTFAVTRQRAGEDCLVLSCLESGDIPGAGADGLADADAGCRLRPYDTRLRLAEDADNGGDRLDDSETLDRVQSGTTSWILRA